MITIANGIHDYMMLNVALLLAYLISRTILCLKFTNQYISQANRLTFARFTFGIVIIAFLLMPPLTALLPTTYSSTYKLSPLVKSASSFLIPKNMTNNSLLATAAQPKSMFSINFVILFICLIGIGISSIKYISTFFTLKQIQLNSFCRHQIGKIRILFNNDANVPYCWSLLRSHFIVIPSSYLENNRELMLALRHELQHLRQGDTYWIHILSFFKILCFWNPIVKYWLTWFAQLQEFSCDEAIVSSKATSIADYAECLLNAAKSASHKLPAGVLTGMHNVSDTILFKRINGLFHYKKNNNNLLIKMGYLVAICFAVSSAYALNSSSTINNLSEQQLHIIIQNLKINPEFQLSATPEVATEINRIIGSKQSRSYLQNSLIRMNQYQNVIFPALDKAHLPNELAVIPLVESGYQPLEASKNRVFAAGIWQIIPETANRFNLVVTNTRDDRLNTDLSTGAAIAYLKFLYAQFHDWKLAMIAYEIGENETTKLINRTHSRDAWVLARSPFAPKNLKSFLATLDAEFIIMKNPTLIQ